MRTLANIFFVYLLLASVLLGLATLVFGLVAFFNFTGATGNLEWAWWGLARFVPCPFLIPIFALAWDRLKQIEHYG